MRSVGPASTAIGGCCASASAAGDSIFRSATGASKGTSSTTVVGAASGVGATAGAVDGAGTADFAVVTGAGAADMGTFFAGHVAGCDVEVWVAADGGAGHKLRNELIETEPDEHRGHPDHGPVHEEGSRLPSREAARHQGKLDQDEQRVGDPRQEEGRAGGQVAPESRSWLQSPDRAMTCTARRVFPVPST